jgi:hypothetical protein
VSWFYLPIGVGICLFGLGVLRSVRKGRSRPLPAVVGDGIGPSRVVRRELLPVLFLSANPFVLERGEFFHVVARAAFCGAELPEPVFGMDGRLTADNQRIFQRCLFEQGRGELLLTTRRLVFRGEGGMQLMLSLADIENHAVFSGCLILGGPGYALDIFRLDEPEQVAAFLELLDQRHREDMDG